jgi:pimeloyl-ACP methyl ester carboxylesterase
LIASFIGLLLAVAVALPLVVYFLQERLIFHLQPVNDARRAQIAAAFPAAKEVFLKTKDEVRLHAWQLGNGPDLVLYFGGNAEEVSGMLGEAESGLPGATWLLTDYRGYGSSAGSPSETGLVADALNWYDHAVRELGPVRVFAFGRSLGSGVAVALAARRTLAGVILVTPYDSLLAVARRHYPFLPVAWLLKHRFDSIALAPALEVPMLCLIAGKDELIPPELAERLYAAWGGPKHKLVLAGAPHGDADSAPGFWPAIRRFVSEGNG